MQHPYFIVDVFTDKPLEGNQLAVYTDGAAIDEALLQLTAREMNLAETVFLFPPDKGGDARMKIFTPRTELPFAGHPTLGTAVVVGQMNPEISTVRLETGVGIIPVELERNKSGEIVFGQMDQPIPIPVPYDNQDALFAALGIESSGLPVEGYLNGPFHVYVELESEDAVRALEPNLGALSKLGLIGVNCYAGSGRTWKTRMFAPEHGVPEDAATGSAAGPLSVHLARYGRINFGEQIEISQGSEIGRPSYLYACTYGSADNIERVVVGGSAVIVAEGKFRLE
ncbi:MAG: PhzF family phenazine biosynthesis protein [Acidimicrobiales bacterium]